MVPPWIRVPRILALLPALGGLLLLAGGDVFAQFGGAGLSLYGPDYTEKPDENYLIGYFTYKDGKGEISWTAEAPTDPLVVVSPGAAQNPTGWVAAQQRMPTLSFTSDPLPFTVYLNVTRLMQATIKEATRNGFEQTVDARLFLDDRLIGGQIPGMRSFASQGPFVARMHPEIDVLPAGSRLRFEFTPPPNNDLLSKTSAFTMSLQGADRSRLFLAQYPALDLPFRRPDAFEGTGGDPGSGAGAAAVPVAFSGLAVGFARRRPPAVAGLLAFVLVAGCMGGPSSSGTRDGPQAAGLGGTADASVVPDPGGRLTSGANGTLVGTVADDQRVPLAGAHVGLLGGGRFHQTDKSGQFVFANLTPGTYRIRVDRADYRSLEETVRVEANHVTTFAAFLEPVEKKEAGFRPHPHDNWAGAQRLVVFSGPVELNGYVAGLAQFQKGPVRGCLRSGVDAADSSAGFGQYCFIPFTIPVERPEGGGVNTIQPGTGFVDVKVAWGSENQLDAVGVSFWANDLSWQYFRPFMYPRGNGETTRIATTWEHTDVGHQAFTTWDFFLFVKAGPQQVIRAPLQVEVAIRRAGGFALEAAHEDFWGPNQTFESLVPTTLSVTPQINCDSMPQAAYNAVWVPDRLVPPDTEWLDVRLVQGRNPTVGTPDYSLRYWPGNSRPPTDGTQWPTMTKHASSQGLSKVYHLKIKPEQSDAFYARSSGWRFLLDDQLQGTPPCTGAYEPPPASSIPFTVSVVSHRDPLPG